MSPGDLSNLFPFKGNEEDSARPMGFVFAFHDYNPDSRTIEFYFGYDDNGSLYDQHCSYAGALHAVFPDFTLDCELAEAMHGLVIPAEHTEESIRALMRSRFAQCGVFEMRL